MWEKVFFGLISVFLVALIGLLRTALLKDVKRAEDRAAVAEKRVDEVKLLLAEESKLSERRFHELKTTDVAQDLVQQELGKKLQNLDGSFHHQSGDLERRLLSYQGQVEHNAALSKEARGLAIEGKAKAETMERVFSVLVGMYRMEGLAQGEESAPKASLKEPEASAKQRGEGEDERAEEQALTGPADRRQSG